jgi:hypothetical protein
MRKMKRFTALGEVVCMDGDTVTGIKDLDVATD